MGPVSQYLPLCEMRIYLDETEGPTDDDARSHSRPLTREGSEEKELRPESKNEKKREKKERVKWASKREKINLPCVRFTMKRI